MTRNKRTAVVSSTTTVVRPANARSMTAQPSWSKRRRRAQQSASISSSSLALHPDVRAYAKCLTDPFVNPPVRLGFGCMVPSQLTVLTYRGSFSSGADGMIGAFLLPSINALHNAGGGGVYFTNSPASNAPVLTYNRWFNTAAAVQLYEEVRVISCGLRVTPMIPGTSAPGAAMVGSIPSASFNQLASYPLNEIITNPLMKWGYASSGATVVGRPVDPDSFNFKHDLLKGWPTSTDAPFTIPYIVMNGLPPNYTVLVEAVLHVEGIYGISPLAQTQLTVNTGTTGESSLNRLFSSVEAMWGTVGRLLPSASTVRTAFSLANALLDPGQPPSGSRRYLPSSVQGQLLP